MEQKEQIARIKNAVAVSVGRKIKVRSRKGRNKAKESCGTIEKAFPSIFMVKMEQDPNSYQSGERLVSYSYTDILTHAIELKFMKDEAVGE